MSDELISKKCSVKGCDKPAVIRHGFFFKNDEHCLEGFFECDEHFDRLMLAWREMRKWSSRVFNAISFECSRKKIPFNELYDEYKKFDKSIDDFMESYQKLIEENKDES